MHLKWLYIYLFFLIALAAGCDLNDGNSDKVNRTDRKAETTFTYEIDVANQTSFQVEAINGSITMTGVSDRSTVSISGVKTVGSESVEDAEEHLEQLEISITESASRIGVETIQPEDTGGRRYVVDYEIVLPEYLESVVIQVNGTITIEGMREELGVNLVNGDIQLEEIEASTRVSVVNGTIESDIAVPLDGVLEQTIVNGEIDLTIPDTTSAEFSAQIVNGSISLSGLSLSDQTITDKSVTGTLGSGNGTLSLQITNGEIEVTGRE